MTFGIEVKENEGARKGRKEESLFSFYFFGKVVRCEGRRRLRRTVGRQRAGGRGRGRRR